MKPFKSFITEEDKVKKGKEISVGKNTVKINPDSEELKEVAPPGAKAERMVKHIKKSYSKDGKLTDKERSIAYATAWKHANESAVPGQPAERLGAVTAIPQSERDAAKARILAKTAAKRKEREMAKEELEIEEGLDMKTFKANRRKAQRAAAAAEARKRGHEGRDWYNSGRTYSPDEAKRSRANLDDEERRTRHRSAVDPDDEDNNYSADKTKNPKKLRKQKAMGELHKEALETELEEGLRRKIAAAGLAAAAGLGALGSGGAKAGQWSGEVNARYGSVPAVATDSSVRSGVDKALANLGTSHSASEIKGKQGLTAGANISYSGSAGKSSKVSGKPSPKPELKRTTSSARTSPPVRSAVGGRTSKIIVPPGRAQAFAQRQAELKRQQAQSPQSQRGVLKMSYIPSFANYVSEIMESRRMDREGVDRGDSKRAERAEKARESLAAVKKGEERKIKVSKKYGIEPSKADTVEKRAHKQNHPGSRQEPKERGAKETPLQTHNRRVNRHNQRVLKHGFTSKEKRENEAMAKHTSARD